MKAEAEFEMELTEEGKRLLLRAFNIEENCQTYQNPDGSYTHNVRFAHPDDEFPLEIGGNDEEVSADELRPQGCTCKPECEFPCEGDCGCEACSEAYNDFLSVE